MNTKYTKGPWKWINDVEDRSQTNLVSESENKTILQIYESHGGGWMPQGQDKSLILAAPEMLEALKDAAEKISSEYCSHKGHCGATEATCYAQVQLAAIEKAEGRNE